MSIPLGRFLCVLGLLCATSTACPAIMQYRVTDLGGSPELEYMTPYSINLAGQIVGDMGTMEWWVHGFLWEEGVLTDLGTLPGGDRSEAVCINESGQIAGTSMGPDGNRAVLWENGEITDLGTLPGADDSSASGINDLGEVVGASGTWTLPWYACLWEDGVPTNLGTLPGDVESFAARINNSSQVVGTSRVDSDHQHAVLWQGGAIQSLGTLPGMDCSRGFDINNLGQIIGHSWHSSDGVTRSFLYEDGVLLDIGTLPGESEANASGIGDNGQIVGDSGRRAFLWEDGTIYDLNDYIQGPAGWVLRGGAAVDDLGRIVGFGSLNGESRGFMLTPIPEPGAAVLLAFGVVGLFLRIRSSKNR